MSWDTTACFKSLCSAYTDYQQQPCEQTIQDLQRQIDVLLGVASLGATLKDVSPKQMVYAESLSALVSIINEPNLKNTLYLKSVTALSQLANDAETKVSLQKTFNLASSLTAFILKNSMCSNKQLILQSLILLQKMTYGRKYNIPAVYMGDLLHYLVKTINHSSSDLLLTCLSVLANLCHQNPSVQSYIKSMDDVKTLYRTLFKYLSHSNKSYSVFSLAILTSVVLNEDIGEKVFHGNNLVNIIQLVFNVLITKEDLTTRQYAADLIVELMNCPRISTAISENEMFNTYIYRILNLLHSTDAQTTVKVLELLIAFCQNGATRNKVVGVFVKNSKMDEETQLPTESLSPAHALLHWMVARADDDETMQANLLTMVFVREVLTGAVETRTSKHLSMFISQLLSISSDHLIVNLQIDDEKIVKWRCQVMACTMEILLTLCKEESIKSDIVQQLDIQNLHNMVSHVYTTFSEDLKLLRNPATESSYEIVFLVFRCLELISNVKRDAPTGQEKYTSLIQDSQLIPFIAHALASKSKYLVHASLQIFAEGLKLREFSSKSLGDVLASHNISRQNELSTLKTMHIEEAVQSQPLSIPLSNPLRDVTNTKHTALQQPASIAILTEKLKKGLEIKDSKLSDIMDFYEHKLAALTGRENHLQDLLEAKSAALSQSDRLLAQYRCRQAQSDAECLKLRSMLQDNERKGEQNSMKMDGFQKHKYKLQEQLAALEEKLKSLESTASEHKELKTMFQEQCQKLETVQKSLQAAEEEHHSLAAMNDCLHKNSEKLKSKLECANERIKLMEDEHVKFTDQIKDRENRIIDMKKELEKGEHRLQEKQQENNQLIKHGKELEKQSKKLQKNIDEAKHQISSLQMVCEQHEQTIKEKEDALNQLNAEMEKHTQIAAMIHNLTSGKINVSK